MGVVYEAQQISLGRRVALKVLPFAAVLDSRQIARFKHEAQAAAQLNHPNIVSVFAVGVERGVHYYAMQFIDGQPLDRALSELRERAVEARRREREKGSGGAREPCLPRSPSPRPAGGCPALSPFTRYPISRLVVDLAGQRRPRVFSGGDSTGNSGGGSLARGPRKRHRPSRHQALQSAAGRQRQALGHRLRARPPPDRRHVDADRRPGGHGALHEPRAGAGPGGLGRPSHGHLLTGRDALRVIDAGTGVSRRRGAGPDPAHRAQRAAALAATPAKDSRPTCRRWF